MTSKLFTLVWRDNAIDGLGLSRGLTTISARIHIDERDRERFEKWARRARPGRIIHLNDESLVAICEEKTAC